MSNDPNADARFVRDRMDIVNLIHSYAHHADNGDTAAFADLFLDDAVIDIGFPGITDRASLKRMLEQRPAGGGPKTRHVMTNMVFHEQTGASASGALYFTLMSTDAGKLTPMVTGQYTFTAAQPRGEWRISNWKAEMDASLGQ